MRIIKKLAKAIKADLGKEGQITFFMSQVEGLFWIIRYIVDKSEDTGGNTAKHTGKNSFSIVSIATYDEYGFEVIPEFDEKELQDELNG